MTDILPTCPVCGFIVQDTSDIEWDLEQDAIIRCVSCGSTYIVERITDIRYRVVGDDE